MTTTAIWWVRRDLRLHDNSALTAAVRDNDIIVPLFIFDPGLINSTYSCPKRIAFMAQGLHSLDRDLRQRGSQLYFRTGRPEQILKEMISSTSASRIYAERDHTPYATRRDARIARNLPLTLIGSTAAIAPGEILKSNGTPYTVFTPFSRTWKSSLKHLLGEVLSAPEQISSPVQLDPGEPLILNEPSILPFKPGEEHALRLLSAFTGDTNAPIYTYSEYRNNLGRQATSGLSPYLRFGMLSARQAVVAALQMLVCADSSHKAESAEIWLNELIWRDFYIQILHYNPQVREGNFRNIRVRWINDQPSFDAWCRGQTGYPIVDAAMRQLNQTGWMHNRARMIAASFLTKDLLTDWRWGERWFMQNLIDGDPATNNGGWQWVAGTGTDAAPYFRIFNPVSQGYKFDPDGLFIKKWLPELSVIPSEFLHEPWKMPVEIQQRYGVRIGIEYPAPIVEHNFARQRALQAYQS